MSKTKFIGPAGLRVHVPEGLVEFSGAGVAVVNAEHAAYLKERIDGGHLDGVRLATEADEPKADGPDAGQAGTAPAAGEAKAEKKAK